MIAIYRHLCPNCGRAISDERLSLKLPCSKCLKEKIFFDDFRKHVEFVYKKLKEEGTLKYYAEFYELEKKLENFENFFKEKIGNGLWSAQRTWVKRVFKGESFTIIAPTGVGKTTLAIALSVWLSEKEGKRIYFVLPTTTLVQQVFERILEWGGDAIAFHSKLRKKEKEEFLKKFEEDDFKILITTSQYLARNFEKLRSKKFDFIFVDDVDAFLKASKNIEKVLMLVGFSEKDISWANDIINLKYRLVRERNKEKIEEAIRKINEFNEYIEKKRKYVGQIIMSSATARPRGRKPKLFRELLGFEIGESGGGLRNIVDTYLIVKDFEDLYEKTYDIIKKVGDGGLIFVAKDLGEDYVLKLINYLKEKGINCEAFVSGKSNAELLEKFRKGEIDILIGVAHFYGLLVRGIDIPERVRYTVFFEVPRFKFRLEEGIKNPYFLLYFIDEILKVKKDENLKELGNKIRRFLRESSRAYILLAIQKLEGENVNLYNRGEEFIENVLKAREIVLNYLKDKEMLEVLKKSTNFYIEGEYVYFPDPNTYIQASGRCSRMFAGGLTKGLSVTITTNEKLLKVLEKKISWKYPEFEFKEFSEINLNLLIEEIDRDREIVRKIQRGEIPPEFEDPVKSILFIVESPNKAKTIANFFGKPSVRRRGRLTIYEASTGRYMLNIVATVGHMFDLITDEGFHGVVNINNRWIPIYSTIKRCKKCGETFTDDVKKCPKCGSEEIEDAIERVEAIREFAKEVDLVLIATDPDSVDGKSKVLVKWNGEIIYTTIEELFDKLLENEEFFIFRDHEYIKPRDLYVLGFKDGEVKFVKVNYLIRHFVKKPLYKVRTKTGREIKVTGDHSLFTLDGIKIKEVKPTELSVGDYIISANFTENNNRNGSLLIGEIIKDEIVEIKKENFVGYVYDFDTESDNFVANNVLCHNTEGEKIAWDIYNAISPYVKEIKRAEFHEVTERAIMNAIENPREIDLNLVKAQIVRRIEDRWLGFELSQLLMRYFKRKNMSAGRVQTPVLSWVIKRYYERNNRVHYFFTLKLKDFEYNFDIPELVDDKVAKEIVQKIKKNGVIVRVLEEHEKEVNPLPPFDTQSMISEASRILGWGANKTMQIAQDLFYFGLITYHRTDSIRVSPEGMGIAKRYIAERFGEEYYKGRIWGTGGAHECIRPTKPMDVNQLLELISEGLYVGITRDHLSLYELIFDRFIASQMRPAKVVYRKYSIEIPEVHRGELEAAYKILDNSWNEIYPIIEEKKIEEGRHEVEEVEYKLDSDVVLFTEGSLVSEMRKRGIGRPSTYATIIQKLRKRRYIYGKYWLYPTPLGERVSEFLFKYYKDLISEERTRELEEKMDKIEKGELDYQDALWELYKELDSFGLLDERFYKGK